MHQSQARIPLTRPEVSGARKFRLYLLAKALTVQHPIDGGSIIPAGRMILVMGDKAVESEAAYICDSFFYVLPGHFDPTSKLPADVKLLRYRKPQRILVIPQGKEREWLQVAISKAGL